MFKMSVRNYNESADLEKILRLYDVSSRDFPFFVRNRDFFKHFITYPGVQKEGIFVCYRDEEVDGVAIVSIDEESGLKEGKIIELWTVSDLAIEMLIQEAFDYCRNRGVDMVSIRPPVATNIGKLLLLNKWLKIDSSIMMIKPLCLTPVLKILVAKEDFAKKSFLKRRLILAFEDEIIEVDTAVNPISVKRLDEMPPTPDVLVRMSAKTFLEIAFGLTNRYVAYLRGEIKISGIKNVPYVLQFFASVKVGVPHAAIVDGM